MLGPPVSALRLVVELRARWRKTAVSITGVWKLYDLVIPFGGGADLHRAWIISRNSDSGAGSGKFQFLDLIILSVLEFVVFFSSYLLALTVLVVPELSFSSSSRPSVVLVVLLLEASECCPCEPAETEDDRRCGGTRSVSPISGAGQTQLEGFPVCRV